MNPRRLAAVLEGMVSTTTAARRRADRQRAAGAGPRVVLLLALSARAGVAPLLVPALVVLGAVALVRGAAGGRVARRTAPDTPSGTEPGTRGSRRPRAAIVAAGPPADDRRGRASGGEGGRPAHHPATRRVGGAVLTVLAGLLVFLALVLPRELGQLSPGALLRIPVEGLLGVALLLLAGRARGIVAATAGAVLGLLTLLRVLQMGFLAILGRPFDPVFDWSQLGSGVALIEGSMGRTGALGSAAAAVVLAGALVVLMALSVRRLAGIAARYRTATTRTVALLTVAWLACFALGTQIAPPVPVAARSAAALAHQTAAQVSTSMRDQRLFDEQAAVDAFRGTPPADLLTALRGKDVVVALVESYGRAALENPRFAPTVGAVLDDGTRRLAADGFASRSAFLTSSVTGGGSWLAHATLRSGLRVTNQHSFDELVASDRLTLTGAFRRAGWETVAVLPSSAGPWPEGAFYGFDRTHDSQNLGNRSRTYSGFRTPDQYTLSAFERAERGRPGRGPLMAEIALVSSHWPWAAVPELLDWDDVGDGAVFDGPGAGRSDPVEVVESDPDRMRDGYRRAVEYSLSTLISYVETYGDDDLVLV
ncbi:MAG TPA: hypothetical protein VD813_13995, partial [Pseudonocardia sp.]|nr:hypothetical protein [Pseudonocardia sp.]